MRKILSLAITICLSTSLFSQAQNQTGKLQDTQTWELGDATSADSTVMEQDIATPYAKLEPQVLADIDWLIYNPLDVEKDLRIEKNRFVLMWMSGSPTMHIGFDDRIVTFRGADALVLLTYMMGWTKYSLEHNYSNDIVECTTAAVSTAVSFYTRNRKSLTKNKELEKYAKIKDEDSLKKYISAILSQK